MASTDARPVPIKNTAMRITFPLIDAAGALVSGATGLDSEVSKDAGTFADCTNEATEIATSSGVYYLDLTSTEMNADTVAVIVKSATALTQTIVMYPQEAGDIKVDVQSISGDSTAADTLELFVEAVDQATGQLDSGSFAAGAITASSIATDAITSSEIASSAAAKIADITLRRTWANAEASSDGDAVSLRSLMGAVAKLVNRVGISGSTLTVYKDDDTTALGTQTVTTNASAEPITDLNTD